MQTVLITGFEPFGGETVNPSWEVVKLLDGTIGATVALRVRRVVRSSECGH